MLCALIEWEPVIGCINVYHNDVDCINLDEAERCDVCRSASGLGVGGC
jgi:hypothetical protein